MWKHHPILLLALVGLLMFISLWSIVILHDTPAVVHESKSNEGFPDKKEVVIDRFLWNNLKIGTEIKLKNVETLLQNNTNKPEQGTTNNPDILLTAESNDTIKEMNTSDDLKWLYDEKGRRRLPKNDFHNLIDIKNEFDFVISQQACPKSVEILWLVHSAPENVEKRRTIRETWGSSLDTSKVLIFFLLGTVDKSEDQLKIEAENEAMGDIIQGNYHDSYRNMTYKHVCGLKWFSYYCPLAKFLIKNDDDVFVNSPYLLDYLLENRNQIQEERQLIWCQKLTLKPVERTGSKWEVTVEEYPNEYYPPHCLGPSIIYSGDLVKDLYVEAQKTNYFWIDDVHVTGTLTQQLNVSIKDLENKLKQFSGDELHGEMSANQTLDYFFGQPNLYLNNIKDLWNSVSNSNFNLTPNSTHAV